MNMKNNYDKVISVIKKGEIVVGTTLHKVATPGGFEPPISTVTGWHVRPLHHGALLKSNRAYIRCQAMPTLHESVEKSTLKWRTLKSDAPRFPTPQRVETTPHESVGVTPSPPEVMTLFGVSPNPRWW
jgi:hypothetical protein